MTPFTGGRFKAPRLPDAVDALWRTRRRRPWPGARVRARLVEAVIILTVRIRRASAGGHCRRHEDHAKKAVLESACLPLQNGSP
jgi:hypothetical protein